MRVIFAILIFLLSTAWTQPPESCQKDFRAANEAYEKEDYRHAIDLYERCISAGVRSATLHYNLGNTWYRLEKIGKAILHYEKARLLEPADEDILKNLRFVAGQTIDQSEEENPVLAFLWKIHSFFDLETGLRLLLVGCLLLSLLWSISLFVRGPPRTILHTLSFLLLGLIVTGAISNGFKIHQSENISRGVILDKSADVLSGPGEQFQILFKIHEGARCEIFAKEGDWFSVRINDQVAGYVHKSTMGLVN